MRFDTTEEGAADILTKGNDQQEKNGTREQLRVRDERARQGTPTREKVRFGTTEEDAADILTKESDQV